MESRFSGGFSLEFKEATFQFGPAMHLERFTLGIGDRFGKQGVAQLAALQCAAAAGVEIIPVWNKSNREHNLTGTDPGDTRRAADAAVVQAGWTRPYYLDADHVGLETVERFLPHCEFFTMDVADAIGKPACREDVSAVHTTLAPCLGRKFPALGKPDPLTPAVLTQFLDTYAGAIRLAGRIYRHIAAAKGEGRFFAELSADEAVMPQGPLEIFLILAGLAGEGARVHTIAPKFTGRFNKGVDYAGNIATFAEEFERDIAAVRLAVEAFGLPSGLKISIHSGSDKFSIYPVLARLLARHGAGLHLKTAGTTWLEEVIGLALSGNDGLALAREIYAAAHAMREELCAPYTTVMDIDPSALPEPCEVAGWSGEIFARALAHDKSNPAFSPSFRQLLHVGFKTAADMGPRYLDALDAARETVAPRVTSNLLDRHIRPLFLDWPVG